MTEEREGACVGREMDEAVMNINIKNQTPHFPSHFCDHGSNIKFHHPSHSFPFLLPM